MSPSVRPTNGTGIDLFRRAHHRLQDAVRDVWSVRNGQQRPAMATLIRSSPRRPPSGGAGKTVNPSRRRFQASRSVAATHRRTRDRQPGRLSLRRHYPLLIPRKV